jgi:hypothetical protein
MNELLKAMQVIYASWIIAGEAGETTPPPIPSGSGEFDHALKRLWENGVFPDSVRQALHFVDSSSGLVCLEAGRIQRLATEAKITSDPNPSYTRSEIKVSRTVARHLLARLNISETKAKEWGLRMRAELGLANTTEPSVF